MSQTQPTEREALAQELAQLLHQQSFDTFLQIARTLLDAQEANLFGNTEFKIRELLLKLGVLAYNTHLGQKKTATTAPASPAPTAAARPASKTTRRAGR